MLPKHLARLLSGRNEPSVLEKEALFERIVSGNQARAGIWRSWGLPLGLVTSVAGALVAVLVVLRPARRALSDEVSAFESRGAATQGPSVRLACVDEAQEVECSLGKTLIFEVARLPAGSRYFAAFARRSGDGDGGAAMLWYFPTAQGRSEAIDERHSVLSQAVRLGPPHTPGDYDVYTVFTTSPRTRAELKAALGEALAPKDGMVVVKRHIELRGQP